MLDADDDEEDDEGGERRTAETQEFMFSSDRIGLQFIRVGDLLLAVDVRILWRVLCWLEFRFPSAWI